MLIFEKYNFQFRKAPAPQAADFTADKASLRGDHRSCEEHCLSGCEKLKCQVMSQNRFYF